MSARKVAEERLAEADRHVREGMARIFRQQQVVRELEQDGHTQTAIEAKNLLLQFEDTLSVLITSRNELRIALQEIDAGAGQQN